MQSNGTERRSTNHTTCQHLGVRNHQKFTFTQARDSRNRKVRGLWIRNHKFYLQMRVAGENSPRRIPLEAQNLTAALEEVADWKRDRREQKLPTRGLKPIFSDYCREYLDFYTQAKETGKRASTINRERSSLEMWMEHFKNLRIDKIAKPQIVKFIEKRLKKGTKPRTVNLDVIALRSVLKRARDAGCITSLATDGLKPLKVIAAKKPLLTPGQLATFFEAIPQACEKNAKQFTDYIKFLAFSGCREKEALRIRWEDVDFERQQVTVGVDGLSKNGKTRVIDFNPSLSELLIEMHQAKAPDTSHLFPSPQRGKTDIPSKSFRESLKLSRAQANMPWLGFHDLRHYFCSMCVMSGIDFKTIAEWLGHQDGGVLIGKVYGHLLPEHKKRMAEKVVFMPTVVNSEMKAAS